MGIYTCTMNPAIDLFIETEDMQASKVNRTVSNEIQANGKGVNVSLIMKQLGLDSTALGFSGGFTGRYISDYLTEQRIANHFVEIAGLTRINVFTKVNASNQEFKLVNQGPTVSLEAQELLLNQVKNLTENDYLIISGSLPRGVDPSILAAIAKICQEKGVQAVFDVSHAVVLDCLQYQPYLLKPNEEEIAEWFGLEKLSKEQALLYAKKLIQLGAKNILLSLGADGAMYIAKDLSAWSCNAPAGKVVNTACSGDTLLGSFLTGLIKKQDTAANLAQSVAAGSSTAFRSGLTDFSDVNALQRQIQVKKMEV
ncbi:1-phosphofructokinase [Streptococcus chenjunshii]|uniref:Tagatose-6-phosphate kinase n=1 Tax=Streptococcus chenjunshii TaxID=2173853 RepID=A0A372KQH2_9STRE|nr:1-phosphofructokinase [Streptococcus chenjunshii]AXQ77946.1 1-phosphofructokinase [Streptococcus chenjunshii]RFU51810.1 1-phosphofructokinase [Streptococcus chenjunshii]RFU53898.1 1-phosphofructokinase [Streptococcus chenjunshii]